MSGRILGTTGEIRWSYLVVAQVGPWVLEDGALTASSITNVDLFRASQRPLTFVVQGRSWRWPVATLELTGTSLSATVGPLESSHATLSDRHT